MAIKITFQDNYDFDRWGKELGNVEPSRVFLNSLDVLMHSVFEETQNFVHVDTASLKMSGKVETHYNKATNVWLGEITYGGASAGSVHDPVRYAVYEQSRGHYHDFMAPAYASEPVFDMVFRTDKIFDGE